MNVGASQTKRDGQHDRVPAKKMQPYRLQYNIDSTSECVVVTGYASTRRRVVGVTPQELLVFSCRRRACSAAGDLERLRAIVDQILGVFASNGKPDQIIPDSQYFALILNEQIKISLSGRHCQCHRSHHLWTVIDNSGWDYSQFPTLSTDPEWTNKFILSSVVAIVIDSASTTTDEIVPNYQFGMVTFTVLLDE